MSCLTIQPEPGACPYRDGSPGSCLASLAVATGARGQEHTRCASPDHDDCPTYLGKLLRSLRPHPFAGHRELWNK